VMRVLIWIPVAFQVNAILERRVASLVGPDAMAAIDYARFVTDTLVILIAMPFGLAGLSTMAAMDETVFHAAKLRAIRALVYLGVPISAFLALNAGAVVALVFERGAFDASSVAATTTILSGMAIGIGGQLVGYAGAKFLTARGQNARALSASLAGLACSAAILLLAREALGVGVLGAAAAAQGLVFGGIVLWQLRAIKDLTSELASLLALTLAYGLTATYAWPHSPAPLVWACLFAACFWLLAWFALPWHRRPIMREWAHLRSRV
jgi:putative peptidoglycan lipid II flippase